MSNCPITPHYSRLLDSLWPDHPLRRTVFPLDDRAPKTGEFADPLGEENHSPCPGLIHTYPDKVLLLATLDCAAHCQYCTRGRLVEKYHTFKGVIQNRGSEFSKPWKNSDEIFQWLEKHEEVRDILISGGDPLMLPDVELEELFSKLRKKEANPDVVSSKVWKIGHIKTIRVGSKVPAVMPERITPELAKLLAKHRVWLQLHFIHPDELTNEVCAALDTLAEAGVPMVSQTVLLKGVNDDADTLADLFYGLLKNRVKPYYLFQCDPVLGSSSFRTPVQKGLDLMRELQGRVSGLALPNFCIDAPGGGGKITLQPDTVLRRDGNDILLTNYEGKEYRYPDTSDG